MMTDYPPPMDPGPDCEEDLATELDARPAPPRDRHRHSRAHVREAAKRYKRRDRRRKPYNDYPWWSKRDRNHGVKLQKGDRP